MIKTIVLHHQRSGKTARIAMDAYGEGMSRSEMESEVVRLETQIASEHQNHSSLRAAGKTHEANVAEQLLSRLIDKQTRLRSMLRKGRK